MPVIQTPFKRIGIDIVGPLPPAIRGYTHILVMVDYTTCYPEVVPLCNTMRRSIALELLRMFSRVGFSSEVLTDEGTNFMNRVLCNLWALLGALCGLQYTIPKWAIEWFKMMMW